MYISVSYTHLEYKELAVKIDGSDTDFIELNISCPNVKEGGVSFGTDPDTVKKITYTIKNSINKPLIVKLTTNVSDIKAVSYTHLRKIQGT